MAILSADKKSVTVQKGDTLTQIAVDYAGGYSKYKTLAAINNIPNPNLIYVGQVIKLVKDSASTRKKSANSNKPVITHFGIQSNSDNTLFAVWNWDKEGDHTESYKVTWTYDTGDGVGFDGSSSTITVDKDYPWLARQSTYSIPSNAKTVQFRVKPISETYKKNDVDTKYWEASWSDFKNYTVVPLRLDVPKSAPSLEIKDYKLTASLENINIENATHIEFEIICNSEDNSGKLSGSIAVKKVSIVGQSATICVPIITGCIYKVRCRAYNDKYKIYSEGGSNKGWSDYSQEKKTQPATPSMIRSLESQSKTSIKVSWEKIPTATSYIIEYTTEKDFFDSSKEVNSLEVQGGSTGSDSSSIIMFAYVTGLNGGEEYFFRLKAKNDQGESSWSPIKSIKLGQRPSPPTTWSSTSTAIVGEKIILYWVHNSEDGSSQTYTDLEIYLGNETDPYISKIGKIDENYDEPNADSEENTISQWTLDTSDSEKYPELNDGTHLTWRVRTSGITGELSDWSIERSIDLYAPPTLELEMRDSNNQQINILSSYPFYISALAGPSNQTPIGYHLSIKSNQSYEVLDHLGNEKLVNKDDDVYSKFFDISDPLLVKLTPAYVTLLNGMEYTITCTASMDSGLTSEASMVFTTSLTDDNEYSLNAEIGLNNDDVSTYIRPYCENIEITYYKVIYESGKYIKTSTEIDNVFGSSSKRYKTTTGEKVYSGTSDDGEDIYYCIVEEKTQVYDASLAVYRREFDGSFTEIASGLDSSISTTVIDPHPALDYARYRIVSTNLKNGVISYYDLPGYPIGDNSVIIQWDESWTSFETSEESSMEQPPWSGSLLKIPYNIDISDSNKPDTVLVEYVGRTHPVSYYGTHLGSSANWSFVIPKDDKETLYGLRRLSRWMGDVYVREPSGSGYWANVTVSFSQKHCDVTIPVTLNISRVEGGI